MVVSSTGSQLGICTHLVKHHERRDDSNEVKHPRGGVPQQVASRSFVASEADLMCARSHAGVSKL